jgi:hypothetical protein
MDSPALTASDIVTILKDFAENSHARYCYISASIEEGAEVLFPEHNLSTVKRAIDQAVRSKQVIKLKESEAREIDIRVPFGGRANAVYYTTAEAYEEAKVAHAILSRNRQRQALRYKATQAICDRYKDQITTYYNVLCQDEELDPIFETPQ